MRYIIDTTSLQVEVLVITVEILNQFIAADLLAGDPILVTASTPGTVVFDLHSTPADPGIGNGDLLSISEPVAIGSGIPVSFDLSSVEGQTGFAWIGGSVRMSLGELQVSSSIDYLGFPDGSTATYPDGSPIIGFA